MKRYRPEVDGLRALAVIPVILFHAGVQLLPGGFLGVDVFFVISGYLISRIILDEMEGGGFNLLSFYERRARRILPALFVVMAFTFPLSYWLAPPEAFANYLRSLRATALFFSNVHFWQSLGYFNPTAEDQPLLHTWSLGVEEQFYILFPLLLWLGWRFARRYLLLFFSCLLILFFAICLFQLSQSGDAAFFLLHARAWELLAGVVVTLFERKSDLADYRSGRMAQVIAAVGIICIVYGFITVSSADDVPGWPNLWPVVGTVLTLLGASNSGPAGWVLTARPVVACGLVSYGAYLWHHPLFAFARLYSLNQPEIKVMLALAFLALVLAVVTYYLVERPCRDRLWLTSATVFRVSIVAICAAVAVTTFGLTRNWSETRFDPKLLAQVFPPLYKTETCDWTYPDADQSGIRFCKIGDTEKQNPVVIWGDSHAQALVGGFDNMLKAKQLSGIYLDSTKCLRVPGVYNLRMKIAKEAAACLKEQQRVYTILSKLNPSLIIVSMRWTLRLFPLPGAGENVGFDNGEGGIETETIRQLAALDDSGKWNVGETAKARAVANFFGDMVKLAPLVVIGPVPEVGWHVGNRNFKTMILRHQPPEDITTSFALFEARNAAALRILYEAQRHHPFNLIEPSKMLCETIVKARCVAQFSGTSYYSDDDHLSQAGAAMVVDQVMHALPQRLLPQP